MALTLGVALLAPVGKAQTVEWARSAGSTSSFEQGNGISVDAAGNSHVTGFATGSTMFGPFTPNDGGFFVAKYDDSGNVIWVRSASESTGGQGNAIVTDASGNSYTTGFFHATMIIGELTLNAVGAVDIFVVKYDSGGNVLWARSAGSTGFDAGGGITVDASGNCYVAGTFSAMATFGEFTLSSAGVVDIFVAKYDPDGNVLWARSAGGTSDDHGFAIGVDAAGNSYVTGFTTGTVTFGQLTLSAGGSRPFVAKYDPSGSVLWAQLGVGSLGGSGSGIAVDATGNHHVTGSFGFQNVGTITFDSLTLTSVGGRDIFVVKFDGSGSALWARAAGGTSDDVGTAIAVDAAGNSYVTGLYEDTMTFGSFSLTSAGDSDVFAAKYDPGGNVLWVRSAGGLESDRGIGIGVDAAGNSVVTGYYQSTATFDPFMLTSAGGQDIFVAEYNTCGSGSVDPGEECDGGFGCTNCSCDADFEPTAPPSLECQPICGSGSVDPGEECDGGLGCTDCLCDADFEPMTPPSLDCQPTCGNDNVDPGEQCDGMDDAACPGACLSDCTCGPFCGDGVCDPGEDSCNCPDDCGPPDESETPGSTCSDGLDNDCDGDADCRDPDCDEDPDCEGVPTVSQWGMTVLLVALLAGIALKFRRSRTT